MNQSRKRNALVDYVDYPISQTPKPEYTLGDKLKAISIWFDNILAKGDPRYSKTYQDCLRIAKKQRQETQKKVDVFKSLISDR